MNIQSQFDTTLQNAVEGRPENMELLLIHVLENRLTEQQVGELRGRFVNLDAGHKFTELFQSVFDLKAETMDLGLCKHSWEKKKYFTPDETNLYLGTIQALLTTSTLGHSKEPSLEQLQEGKKSCLDLMNNPSADAVCKTLVQLPLAIISQNLLKAHQNEENPQILFERVIAAENVGTGIPIEANFYYARFLMNGAGEVIPQNSSAAYKLFKKIYENPLAPKTLSVESKFHMAEIHYQHAFKEGNDESYQAAFKIYIRLVEDPELSLSNKLVVRVRLGIIYRLNHEYQHALSHYQLAYSDPNLPKKLFVEAAYGMMKIYFEGGHGIDQNKNRALTLGKEILNRSHYSTTRNKTLMICSIICEETNPEEALEYYEEMFNHVDQKKLNELIEKSIEIALKLERWGDAFFFLTKTKKNITFPAIPDGILRKIPKQHQKLASSFYIYHYIMNQKESIAVKEIQRTQKLPPSLNFISLKNFLLCMLSDNPNRNYDSKHKILRALFPAVFPLLKPFFPPGLKELEFTGKLISEMDDEYTRPPYEETIQCIQTRYFWLSQIPKSSSFKASGIRTLILMLYSHIKESKGPAQAYAHIQPEVVKAKKYLHKLKMGFYNLDGVKQGKLQSSIETMEDILAECETWKPAEPVQVPDTTARSKGGLPKKRKAASDLTT